MPPLPICPACASNHRSTSATAYSINGLGSDQETRNVVCAGFALDAGQVDPNVYTYTDPVNYNVTKYVIAGLRTVIPAGVPPVDVARDEIMPAVVNRKKAELIKGQIKTNDLRGLASQFGVALDTVSNVALSQATVPKLGSEHTAALAAMFRTASGSLSSPVTGETGVFIVQPLSAPGTAPASNMPAVRGQIERHRPRSGHPDHAARPTRHGRRKGRSRRHRVQ